MESQAASHTMRRDDEKEHDMTMTVPQRKYLGNKVIATTPIDVIAWAQLKTLVGVFREADVKTSIAELIETALDRLLENDLEQLLALQADYRARRLSGRTRVERKAKNTRIDQAIWEHLTDVVEDFKGLGNITIRGEFVEIAVQDLMRADKAAQYEMLATYRAKRFARLAEQSAAA